MHTIQITEEQRRLIVHAVQNCSFKKGEYLKLRAIAELLQSLKAEG